MAENTTGAGQHGPETPVDGLVVRGLSVRLGDGTTLVDEFDLDARRGELVAVVGASGAGKSTVLKALLGRLPRGCTSHWTQAKFGTSNGTFDLDRADVTTWRSLRRQHMRMVFQDPAAALAPLRRVNVQIAESARLSGHASDDASVLAVLKQVGFDDPGSVAHRRSHTLSGGMAQRVGIALALAARPSLVLADEPTTALDPVAADAALRALRMVADAGAAVVVVTHDLETVGPFVDRVVELPGGRATTSATIYLGGASASKVSAKTGGSPALQLTNLTVGFGDRLVLVNAALQVGAGEVVGLRGPSGTGKSTLLGAVAGVNTPRSGKIRIGGIDATSMSRKDLRRRVQLVPQHPREALNPWRTAQQLVREPLDIHRDGQRRHRQTRAHEVLARFGLGDRAQAYPAELSTGQCQRLCLARALILDPLLLLADEPVSSLDPELADEMLALLAQVAAREGAGVLLVSHDHRKLQRVADRVEDLADLSLDSPMA